jgi:hypothetical protein
MRPKMGSDLSERSLSDSSKTTSLFGNVEGASNVLGSVLRFNDEGSWTTVLEPQIVGIISSFRSASNLRELVSRTGSDGEADGWLGLQAVIGDLPVPTELSEDIRKALENTDFVELYRKNSRVAMLAVSFAANHAAYFGKEIIDKVRERLLKFAVAFHEGQVIADDTVQWQLLSAAYSLYSRGGSAGRYREISSLLSQVVKRWPGIADHCKRMVDRLVEGTPNSDSRHLWKLQVELRSHM